MPAADARGAREIVVRLGALDAAPLALASIEIAARDASVKLDDADARLCGPAADPYPLSIDFPGLVRNARPYPWPVAPLLASRRASDDLCVRFVVK